jgi:hypothetical protein
MGWSTLALMLLVSATTRRSPAGEATTVNFPLFLIALLRTSKSLEIFKLTSFRHIAIRVEAYKAQAGVTTANNSAVPGLTASNLAVACGVGAVTCTRNAGNGQHSIDTDMLQLQVGGWRGTSSLQLSRLRARQGRQAKEKVGESASHPTPGLSFAAMLRSNTQQQQQPQPPSVAQACAPSLEAQAMRTKSMSWVQAPNANSSSLNDKSTVVATAFQQIITDRNGAESE